MDYETLNTLNNLVRVITPYIMYQIDVYFQSSSCCIIKIKLNLVLETYIKHNFTTFHSLSSEFLQMNEDSLDRSEML